MPSHQLGSIKVHTFPLPGEGFDPLVATDEELARFGFPRRPDVADEPGPSAQWHKAFADYGRYAHLAPEFKSLPHVTHGPVQRVNEEAGKHIVNATSFNWSGSVVFVDPAVDTFSWMFGTWTVPNARQSPVSGDTQYSSAWLGIDGDGSGDVMQAGTETDSDGTCYAWFEWYPDFSHYIPNFPVAPGDVVSLVLCHTGIDANGNDTAWISFGNRTAQNYTSFAFTAPPGTTLVGNCAEFVVERPGVNGALAELPRYGAADGDDVTAYTVGGGAYAIGAGVLISMVADDGVTVISAPDTEGVADDRIALDYVGP